MRADWTPEAEARVRETYPRMVDCPPPAVHAHGRDPRPHLHGDRPDQRHQHRQSDLQGAPAHGDVAAPEPRRRAEVRADQAAVFLRGGGVHGVRPHLDALRLDQPHRARARRAADRQDAAGLAHGAGRVARLRAQGAERLHRQGRDRGAARRAAADDQAGLGVPLPHRLVSQVRDGAVRVHPRLSRASTARPRTGWPIRASSASAPTRRASTRSTRSRCG